MTIHIHKDSDLEKEPTKNRHVGFNVNGRVEKEDDISFPYKVKEDTRPIKMKLLKEDGQIITIKILNKNTPVKYDG